MARRLRYSVAMSLDGFIADPEGGYDWIVHDPTIDFGAIFQQYDTLVMGRKTYEVMKKQGQDSMPGVSVVVLSRTLRQENHPKLTIVSEDAAAFITGLKQRKGRDICCSEGASCSGPSSMPAWWTRLKSPSFQ